MVGCALFGDLFESHMTRGPKLAAAWCYLLLAAAVQRSAHAQRTNIDRGPETNELPPGLVSLVTPAKPDRGEFEMSFHILQTIPFSSKTQASLHPRRQLLKNLTYRSLHSAQCTVRTAQCTVHSTQCTPHLLRLLAHPF